MEHYISVNGFTKKSDLSRIWLVNATWTQPKNLGSRLAKNPDIYDIWLPVFVHLHFRQTLREDWEPTVDFLAHPKTASLKEQNFLTQIEQDIPDPHPHLNLPTPTLL